MPGVVRKSQKVKNFWTKSASIWICLKKIISAVHTETMTWRSVGLLTVFMCSSLYVSRFSCIENSERRWSTCKWSRAGRWKWNLLIFQVFDCWLSLSLSGAYIIVKCSAVQCVPSWSENWTVYQVVSLARSRLFLAVRAGEHNFSNHRHHSRFPRTVQ